MGPEEYYLAQLELECKSLLPSGRLTEFPCDNPDGLAPISVVRYLDGTGGAIRLRDDIGPDVERAIAGLTIDDLLSREAAPYANVLKRSFAGRTGVLIDAPPEGPEHHVERDGGRFVIRVGGTVVAGAHSARENKTAAELSVETDARHRRLGYGKAVATSWARDVIASGRIAFYSYDFANLASGALARSLGVQLQFEAGSFILADEP